MLSAQTKRRLDVALASTQAGDELEATLIGILGAPNVYWLDTVNGNDGYHGKYHGEAFKTVDYALGKLGDDDALLVKGDVRAQTTAPTGVYGVKVIGASGGRPRHATSGGTAVSGLGASWREEATAGDAPLLILPEQGWEFHNLVMIPQSGYSAVRLYRTATDSVDGSHAVFSGVKFISGGTRVGYGIEDVGGAYHIKVEGCEFKGLEFAWKQTSVGIASPQEHIWRGNHFYYNKTDIAMNACGCTFEANYFHTPYDGTNHPTTLDLASTADAGEATRKNMVIDNIFADAAADVTIAKGYKPATGDIWRNRVTNTAADIVAVPT